MRFMVLVKATEEREQGIMPFTDLLEAMGSYNEELAEAAILLAGENRKPSSQASVSPLTEWTATL